ncbi:MAG: contractile injection system protein, VgrG/Pvc8 family [Haloarculaceae archaeon]
MSDGRQGPHVPRFEVTIGGTTMKSADGGISDVVVETSLDGADRFSVTLNEAFDPEHEEFPGLTWDDFSTGKSVEISLGWEGVGEVKQLFVGKIHQLRSSVAQGEGASIGVSGYGLLHDMMGKMKDRSWSKATVGDVVQEVLSSYFGDRTVDADGMNHDKIYQHDQSDYRFVADLATKYGYQFYAQQNAVYFTPRADIGSEEPSVRVSYPGVLQSFSGEVNEASAVKEVVVRHYDMQKETEIVGRASTDATNTKKEVFRIPCASNEEAEQIAKTKLDRLSSSRATCYGEVSPGLAGIKAGTTIGVDGVGSRFAKNYYVTNTTHRVGGSGYRTTFEATEVPG